MIAIKDITDYLWVQCPNCDTYQCITQWGPKKCQYLGEDGNTPCGYDFSVDYNPELLLEEAVKLKKDYDKLLLNRFKPPKPSKLQKYPDGNWVLIPQ